MNPSDAQIPEEHLVTVYTLDDAVTAELIRNTLQEHDIKCELGGEHQAGFTGALEVEIIVRETDRQRAAELIAEMFPHS